MDAWKILGVNFDLDFKVTGCAFAQRLICLQTKDLVTFGEQRSSTLRFIMQAYNVDGSDLFSELLGMDFNCKLSPLTRSIEENATAEMLSLEENRFEVPAIVNPANVAVAQQQLQQQPQQQTHNSSQIVSNSGFENPENPSVTMQYNLEGQPYILIDMSQYPMAPAYQLPPVQQNTGSYYYTLPAHIPAQQYANSGPAHGSNMGFYPTAPLFTHQYANPNPIPEPANIPMGFAAPPIQTYPTAPFVAQPYVNPNPIPEPANIPMGFAAPPIQTYPTAPLVAQQYVNPNPIPEQANIPVGFAAPPIQVCPIEVSMLKPGPGELNLPKPGPVSNQAVDVTVYHNTPATESIPAEVKKDHARKHSLPDAGLPNAYKFVPDELKDEKYWKKRRLNTEATRRARVTRRAKIDGYMETVRRLEVERLALQESLLQAKNEQVQLKQEFEHISKANYGIFQC